MLGWALCVPADTVTCGGTYPQHLQGVTTDGDALYWSFTDRLVKTDGTGRVLRTVTVPAHHGDLCWYSGTLYVAVNLGVFNAATGADSQVWAYDPDTLAVRRTWPLPEVVHGAGGIAIHGGSFWVVGGLPETGTENVVYEYGPGFAFVRGHALATGYTALGLQTIDYAFGAFRIGVYGTATGAGGYTLVVSPAFDAVTRIAADTSVGILNWRGRLWRAGVTGTSGYICTDESLAGTVGTDWPDDFAEQVAAHHPRPVGGQVASGAAREVDARTHASADAADAVLAVEGRATLFETSGEQAVDARRPSGCVLVLR